MSLEAVTADCLHPLRHGFFTRKGGASSGIYAGLNCGQGSGDQAQVVAINRARVADALGVQPAHLQTLHQVHSSTVITLHAPLAPQDQVPADAMVTKVPGLALGVLTADCAPVLLADTTTGVIGVAHAGWRGALGGVLRATVDAMVAQGAQPALISAVIGPTISQRAYEVGPEFLDAFVADDPDHTRFFANGQNGRMQFDLPGFALACLRQAGVGHAEWTGHCTYSDPERFYSYRRSVHGQEVDYGRLIAGIVL